MLTLQQHVEAYERDGFTIFSNFYPPEKVEALRALLDPDFTRRHAEEPDRWRATINGILSHETYGPLMGEHIVNPTMLDFAEAVMGPYVQLDGMEISGYPTVDVERKGEVAGWHRDAFNQSEQWAGHNFPYKQEPRHYTPPMACNYLTYLQDMTAESGPLRVIPRSHLDYTMIPEEKLKDPHPNEKLVELKAGDMVFTHCDLYHTGTVNTVGAIRYFISSYFCRIGLPHRDTFETPVIKKIVADARKRNDRRILRLFGINEGFHQRQQTAWQQMTEDDKKALNNE